jgi:hypothetical protein
MTVVASSEYLIRTAVPGLLWGEAYRLMNGAFVGSGG